MKQDINYGGFDPSEFCVPAQDQHGHSERIWTRIQEGYDREMDTIISSRMFPYKTKSDLIRHAVKRHLLFLNEVSPLPLQSVMGQAMAIEELMREEQYLQQFTAMTTRLHEMVNNYLANSEDDKARSLVARVVAKINDMPESSWKDKYKRDVNDKFNRLFGARGIPLISWSED